MVFDSSSKPIISVRNLSKTFDTKHVLNDISFDVYEGEKIVIIGGSGCGKTVLIKLLSGLMQADGDSSIMIDGHEVCGMSELDVLHLFDKISFAFQLNALFDSYKVWENICFKYLFKHDMKKDDLVDLAKKLLVAVGLNANIADFYPKDLSGGMQKRVAIARAFASSPLIVFFDEPTSGLDPLTSEKITCLIRDFNQNDFTVGNLQNHNARPVTKISIMHDMKSAKLMADRIIFLKDGQIRWMGRVDEIDTSKNADLIEFINSGL
jgi:phospholipid/cholesterol/gamma-HCH transport system ATP-binding protein